MSHPGATSPPPPPPPSSAISASLPPSTPPILPNPSSPRRTQTAAQTHTPGTGALQDDTLHALILRLDRRCQQLLDRVAPYQLYRWITLVSLLAIFMLRILYLEGFYIVVYALFIYILNHFILFLQPKDRASLIAKVSNPDEAPALPTNDDDEFRPFVRRLPEFRFWYSTTFATLVAIWTTFFPAFDVPVFWPVLLFYSVVLFVATMRRQWLDMKKLKYVPWDIGAKKVYKTDPKKVSVTRTRPTPPIPRTTAAPPIPVTPVPTVSVPSNTPTTPST